MQKIHSSMSLKQMKHIFAVFLGGKAKKSRVRNDSADKRNMRKVSLYFSEEKNTKEQLTHVT